MYVSNNYFVIHYVILTVLSPCMSCFGITYLYLRLVILRACPTAVYDVTVHTYSGITYVHNLLVIVSIQTTIHTCSKRMQLKYSTSALFFNCQHNYCTCTYVNDTTSRYTHCLVTAPLQCMMLQCTSYFIMTYVWSNIGLVFTVVVRTSYSSITNKTYSPILINLL